MVTKTLFGQSFFARLALSNGDCKSMSPFNISTGTFLGKGPVEGRSQLGREPRLRVLEAEVDLLP